MRPKEQPHAITSKTITRRSNFKRALDAYAFISPAIVLILIFGIVPLFLAAYISFFDFPLINPARREFIGLQNYADALGNASLGKAALNTLYYAIWQIPVQTVLALILALLVEKPLRGVGFFRASFYLPVVISMVVASTLWRVMLDSQNGLINSLLLYIGLPRQPFLTSTSQALPTLALMLSWKWVGFSMIIFLAGLHAIPDHLYEAGQLDGASRWQSLWHITLPLLRSPAIYVIVTNTINAAKLFTPIYVITRGGPEDSTLVVVFYIFREAFVYGNLGYASAIAVLFTLLLVALASAQLRLMRSAEAD